MGFDDMIHANDTQEKIKAIVKPLVSYYVDGLPTEEELEKYEKTMCYNGYSLAYHPLKPTITAFIMGSCPHKLTDADLLRISVLTRRQILMILLQELTGTD